METRSARARAAATIRVREFGDWRVTVMVNPENQESGRRAEPPDVPERSWTAGRILCVVGYITVVVGAVLVVIGLADTHGRAETTGEGLAVVMVGMLVVLAGNYAHHGDGPTSAPNGDPE